MAQQKRRPANDRAFKKYQANNQALKNKKEKLEKHCKNYPKDEQAAKRLAEINHSKVTYNKTAAKVKGSTIPTKEKINELENLVAPYNRKQQKIRPKPKMYNYITSLRKNHPTKTMEEQVRELFGIIARDEKSSKKVKIVTKPGKVHVYTQSLP